MTRVSSQASDEGSESELRVLKNGSSIGWEDQQKFDLDQRSNQHTDLDHYHEKIKIIELIQINLKDQDHFK